MLSRGFWASAHHLLACSRPVGVRGPRTHHGSIITDKLDDMWTIDPVTPAASPTRGTLPSSSSSNTARANARVCVRAVLRGTRFEAMECLREAIRTVKGRHDTNIATGMKLHHDHRSQLFSHAFQDDLNTAGIESRSSFVRQPEDNGCVEQFIHMRKEQLLWLHRFHDVAKLNEALRDFAHRFNNHWIVGRIRYRTPAAHRRLLRGEAGRAPPSTCLRNWVRHPHH